MVHRRPLVLAFLLSGAVPSLACAADAAPSASESSNVETLAERSQSRARAVLDRAVDALGGERALREIEVVRLQLDGELYPRLQMTTPAPPYVAGTQQETLLVDLKNNRLFLEQKNTGAGFEQHATTVIGGGEGATYDHRARTATPIPAAQASQQQFIQYYRRIPHLLLRQALDRATTLRHLGEDTLEGRPHEVLTFVMPDAQQVALYVDAKSGLLSKYELVFTDPLAGEDASEILFRDYATANGRTVPRRWEWRQAGERMADLQLRVELNPAVGPKAFEFAGQGYAQVAAVPQTFEERVEDLGDGAYIVHNVAGQNQNSLVVEFADHVMVVEAPGSSEGSEAVIAKIRERSGSKPIRYVVMTHHHGDHIGGLRSYIAEGATVVTTSRNRGIVETMAAAPQVDRLARQPRKPEFLFVDERRRTFADGRQRLELVNVGPHPHAWDMFVAYLPKQKLVFQGDLFFVPANDAPQGPPQASTLAFAERLRDARLDVKRIGSVHGRTATIAEFREATRGPG